MSYISLFLTFLEIGTVSFGGGYGMISLIRERVLANAWLTESELLNFIAVSESTPGPLAVNMATFIGSAQGGFWGSLIATLGVILPAFIIKLIIAALIGNFLKYSGVKAFMNGVRPCVIGLILATALTMTVSGLFGISTVSSEITLDIAGIIVFALLLLIAFCAKKITKKTPSPVLMILISAVLGMLIYPPLS